MIDLFAIILHMQYIYGGLGDPLYFHASPTDYLLSA